MTNSDPFGFATMTMTMTPVPIFDVVPPVKIFDTSRHNHGAGALLPIDFVKARAAGYTVWCGRASVGDYYIDEWFQRDYDAAQAAGLICLAYHVTVPISNDVASMDNFFNALGGRRPVGVVIDAEWNITPSAPLRVTQCNAYHADLFSELVWGPRVLLYTNQNYSNKYLLDNFGLPLWVASPGVGGVMNPAPRPSLPRLWADYFMWQRSWRESIPGIPDTTSDYSEWNSLQSPAEYFTIIEAPMSDELLARIEALEARVTALEGGAHDTPPPPPVPVADTVIVTADPRANARYSKANNQAKPPKPIMQIYPSDSSPASERIQFNKGAEIAVTLPMVLADGGMKHYKLRDRKGRAGETLYIKATDARLQTV